MKKPSRVEGLTRSFAEVLEGVRPFVEGLGLDIGVFKRLKGDFFSILKDLRHIRSAIVTSGDQPLSRELQFDLAHRLSRMEGIIELYFEHLELEKFDGTLDGLFEGVMGVWDPEKLISLMKAAKEVAGPLFDMYFSKKYSNFSGAGFGSRPFGEQPPH